MNKLSLKTKLIAGVLTGGMVLSSVSFAFADSNPSGSKSATVDKQTAQSYEFGRKGKCNGVGMGVELKNMLKTAVTSNIITQAESDKILAYKAVPKEKGDKTEKRVKHDMFSELVSNKILTQARADALKASFKSQRVVEQKKNMETKLETLVTDKTITKDQATKIEAKLVASMGERKALMEKAKGMTEAQRKTYFESLKAENINPFKALVTDGTITQAQADKVVALFHKGMMKHDGTKGKRGNDTNKTETTITKQ